VIDLPVARFDKIDRATEGAIELLEETEPLGSSLVLRLEWVKDDTVVVVSSLMIDRR
jgi:hypothetical protein